MTETSSNAFEEFRKLVLEREDLQAELKRFTDKETFIDRVTTAGARHGYHFLSSDVEEALSQAWREWIERAI